MSFQVNAGDSVTVDTSSCTGLRIDLPAPAGEETPDGTAGDGGIVKGELDVSDLDSVIVEVGSEALNSDYDGGYGGNDFASDAGNGGCASFVARPDESLLALSGGGGGASLDQTASGNDGGGGGATSGPGGGSQIGGSDGEDGDSSPSFDSNGGAGADGGSDNATDGDADYESSRNIESTLSTTSGGGSSNYSGSPATIQKLVSISGTANNNGTAAGDASESLSASGNIEAVQSADGNSVVVYPATGDAVASSKGSAVPQVAFGPTGVAQTSAGSTGEASSSKSISGRANSLSEAYLDPFVLMLVEGEVKVDNSLVEGAFVAVDIGTPTTDEYPDDFAKRHDLPWRYDQGFTGPNGQFSLRAPLRYQKHAFYQYEDGADRYNFESNPYLTR